MAISGLQTINIGLQNESIGSDSLYTAFNKTKTNFQTLFDNASPFNTFTAGDGISTDANTSSGIVTITNTGVTSIIAGTNISISASNGDVTISAAGGGGGSGTVTSVGINSSTLTVNSTVSGNIVSSGNLIVDLPSTAVVAGTYSYPTITVDQYGRITNAVVASSVGTVTSVAVSPGYGIQVTGSPITTSGTINILNTGVTRLTAGSGISLSGSNGNITVATSVSGNVSSVGITSSTLTVTGSPVTSSGTIVVNIPGNISLAGNITGGNLISSGKLVLSGSEDLGDAQAANLAVVASYFSTSAAETATLAAGTAGQIKTFMMVVDTGDMVITVTNAGWKSSGTGTMTFNAIGVGCTLQYINSKWFCIGNNGVVFA
jgi:hypothetical protein